MKIKKAVLRGRFRFRAGARAQEIQLARPVSHPLSLLACSNSLYKVLTCVPKKLSICGLGCPSAQLCLGWI